MVHKARRCRGARALRIGPTYCIEARPRYNTSTPTPLSSTPPPPTFLPVGPAFLRQKEEIEHGAFWEQCVCGGGGMEGGPGAPGSPGGGVRGLGEVKQRLSQAGCPCVALLQVERLRGLPLTGRVGWPVPLRALITPEVCRLPPPPPPSRPGWAPCVRASAPDLRDATRCPV